MYSLCLIQRRPCISTLVYHISIASTVNIDNSCCFASSGNDDICCAHLAAFNSDPERAGDDDHPLQSYKQNSTSSAPYFPQTISSGNIHQIWRTLLHLSTT